MYQMFPDFCHEILGPKYRNLGHSTLQMGMKTKQRKF